MQKPKQTEFNLHHFLSKKLGIELYSNGRTFERVGRLWRKVLAPLLATGGPGASRVLLFSASILFFSTDLSAPFGGDFFLLMLLNTAFSQSFGFFLLRADYNTKYRNIYLQSLVGFGLGALACAFLWWAGLIHSLYFSLTLLALLHGYYVLRYRFIANQRFIPLAIAEIIISLICVLGPLIINLFAIQVSVLSLYQVYAFALLLGLAVLAIGHRKLEAHTLNNSRVSRPSFSEVSNIAISTTGGIFAVFILPAAIKQISSPEIVSIVALAVSCISISILLPRTYANTVLTKLADPLTEQKEIQKIGERYQKLVLASVGAAYVVTISYMGLIGISITEVWWIPLIIALLILVAQNGFVVLTYLSLQKQDAYVARLNLITLIGNAFYILVALSFFATTMSLMVALGCAIFNFILRNFFAKRYSQRAMSY